jgi:hypothetical protein
MAVRTLVALGSNLAQARVPQLRVVARAVIMQVSRRGRRRREWHYCLPFAPHQSSVPVFVYVSLKTSGSVCCSALIVYMSTECAKMHQHARIQHEYRQM